MRLLAQKDLFPFLSNLFRCYFSHLISLIIRTSLTLCQHAHYTCILTSCQYVFSFILGSSNNVNPNQSICRSSLTAACSESYLHSASPSQFPVVRTIVIAIKRRIPGNHLVWVKSSESLYFRISRSPLGDWIHCKGLSL